MIRLSLVLSLVLALPVAAHADCAADIDKALIQASKLPQSSGRNAVLEEIERARAARHEGDEAGCEEEIGGVLETLRKTAPPAQTK